MGERSWWDSGPRDRLLPGGRTAQRVRPQCASIWYPDSGLFWWLTFLGSGLSCGTMSRTGFVPACRLRTEADPFLTLILLCNHTACCSPRNLDGLSGSPRTYLPHLVQMIEGDLSKIFQFRLLFSQNWRGQMEAGRQAGAEQLYRDPWGIDYLGLTPSADKSLRCTVMDQSL